MFILFHPESKYYWTGKTWHRAQEKALQFETKEAAESYMKSNLHQRLQILEVSK